MTSNLTFWARLPRVFILSALLAAGAGCEQGKNGIAVLDLDAVAAALGRDDVIQQQILSANQQLSGELAKVRTQLQEQLTEEQARLGQSASEEAQEALRGRAAEANRQLKQTQALAQQRATQFRAAVVNEFRKDVMPVAAEIAKARGLDVVLTAAVPMVWYNPEVDITDEVIAALRAAAGEPAAAAANEAGTTAGADESAAAQ